jgi:acyl-CoA reductase-like NAD-dependent aldehyde dehydrogenase
MGNSRVGGLRVDPQTKEWMDSAAENTAALTKKQKKDRQRVRLRIDCERYPWLKDAVEAAAEHHSTSASQMAAFLLAWGMRLWMEDNADLLDELLSNLNESKTLRFDRNLDIPRAVERAIRAGLSTNETD